MSGSNNVLLAGEGRGGGDAPAGDIVARAFARNPNSTLETIGIVARASSPVKAQSDPLAWQVPKRSRAGGTRSTRSCYMAPRICAPRDAEQQRSRHEAAPVTSGGRRRRRAGALSLGASSRERRRAGYGFFAVVLGGTGAGAGAGAGAGFGAGGLFAGGVSVFGWRGVVHGSKNASTTFFLVG